MTYSATPTSSRRYSVGAVIGAGRAGLAVGACAAFAITGLVFTVRLELPPPPYPPVVSSMLPSPPQTPPLPVPPLPPLPPGRHS
jgi:hypothetical protein